MAPASTVAHLPVTPVVLAKIAGLARLVAVLNACWLTIPVRNWASVMFSVEATSEPTLTWLEPPNTMPLRLITKHEALGPDLHIIWLGAADR